jgi:hypothetical protein
MSYNRDYVGGAAEAAADELAYDSYEEEGSEIEGGGGDDYYEDAQAGLSTKLSGGHLTKDMFSKAQTVTLCMDIQGSPEQLEGGRVSKFWRIKPHDTQEFKQIMTLRNRDKATGEERAGNLNRCIPLHLEIVRENNSYPYYMGMKFPGMVPKVLHKSGRTHWRTPPNTSTHMVERAVFEPSNVITKHMYENWRMCSLESLVDDITHVPGNKNKVGYSTIAVDSLAYDVLVSNLGNACDPNAEDGGHWCQYDLSEDDVDDLYSASNRRKKIVTVPTEIAKEIEVALKDPLEEIAKSFVNLEDLVVEFERADGVHAFNSTRNLHGELVGSDIDPNHDLRSAKLAKRACYGITADFTFILF